MSKKIIQAVMERSGGCCELCGSNNLCERHHIIGGSGKRKQCETEQSLIVLCYECHHGTYGWHGREGRALQDKLREELQATYTEMGYSRQEIFRLMGDRFYDREGENAG